MSDNNRKDNNRIYKSWFITVVCVTVGIIIFISALNVIVDPYFHFHKPITKYRLYEERYTNDGIARHFDYDTIIIGNSLAQNFKISQYDELFGTNSVKLPYSGAWYKELWESLDRALSYNSEAKEILIIMDLSDLYAHSNWTRYDNMPEYLYDDKWFNDVNYVLNKTILYRGTCYNILYTLLGNESTTFDDYSSWDRESGPRQACETLDHIEDNLYQRSFDDSNKGTIDENIGRNVLPVIEKHPEVCFKLVFPPNSIAKWAEYYQNNEVIWRIDGLGYALDTLLKYDNVDVYAFDDLFEVSTNLNLYSDTIHYDASVNALMLDEIAKNKHRVDLGNKEQYIESIKNFYGNYDYQSLNEYID